MPFCPKCRYEYRAGFTVCESCGGVPLVAELAKANKLTEEEVKSGRAVGFTDLEAGANAVNVQGVTLDPTRIFVLSTAQDVQDLLREHDVASAIVPLEEVEFPDHVTRFEVRVRASEAERAQAVLMEAFRREVEAEGTGASAVDDVETCPACGAHVPLDVAECPECELVLGMGNERGGGTGEEVDDGSVDADQGA